MRFFLDLFKFTKGGEEKQEVGSQLHTTPEDHNQKQLSDSEQNAPLGLPGYVLQPADPEYQFDTTPPKCAQIRQVVDKVRSASAPGLVIPSDWNRKVTAFIQKSIIQFRGITPLNVEGKLLFALVAK